jgi:phosphoribosylformylglycinamidine (FGAM) synthase PurS component
MKILIKVRPKKGICTPDSVVVTQALRNLGFSGFDSLMIGRVLEIEADHETAERFLKLTPGQAADLGIANFNVETFSVEIAN